MIKKTVLAAALGLVLACGTMAGAAPITDTIEAPTMYFVPDQFSTYSYPYYRWNEDDWSWVHNPIAAPFTAATLSISAWDVDAPSEVDQIYAYDNGNLVLLGTLTGLDDAWGYTTFVLGSNFFDDIAAGLEVLIAIDIYDRGWAVSLSKSVLSLDGGFLPPPNPNPHPTTPEPSTFLLVGAGIAGAVAFRKRFKK